MHCFACNCLLSNPVPDPVTTRYYCSECFSWTIEEQLRLAGKEYLDDFYDLEETNQTLEEEPLKWHEEDENEQDSDYS